MAGVPMQADVPEGASPTRYASGLVAFGKIEGTIYSAVIVAALAVYSAANVAQKATTKASA